MVAFRLTGGIVFDFGLDLSEILHLARNEQELLEKSDEALRWLIK